jgi:hypothetical protein
LPELASRVRSFDLEGIFFPSKADNGLSASIVGKKSRYRYSGCFGICDVDNHSAAAVISDEKGILPQNNTTHMKQ